YEFLTWLWFAMETRHGAIKNADPELESLQVGNRIVLENHRNNTEESITIQGDQAGLEEGALALRKGAVVTELNLIYKSGGHEWRFSIKGESLHLSGLKTPQTGPLENKEDLEGAVLEKFFLFEKALALIHNLYAQFMRLRLSGKWKNEVVPQIRKWILSQQSLRT
ncbi:MAG: hypothetical protein AB1427_20345, partial [Thermodesulfobacteriota bacterium]